jgi:hypothetical protein
MALKAFYTFPGPGSKWLNPVHIATAREGYRIQSQVLGIPDRFGYFSPGDHPPMQAFQGGMFAFFMLTWPITFLAGCFLVPAVSHRGEPVLPLILGLIGLELFTLGSAWALSLLDRRRAPSFDWGD